ncbi:MAG: hypothetical protein WC728_07355 [Elusimicrobiota bacterium]
MKRMLRSQAGSARVSNAIRRDTVPCRIRGSALIETVMAIFIMTVGGVALVGMVQKQMIAVLKAREKVTCGRMSQTGMARIKNIDFYALFSADSSSTNHGLWAAYPYRAVFDGIRGTLLASKYDRFRVTVAFLRRDTADSNANGMISDLVEFSDANGDRVDDCDSGVRYLDQNGDGDFYDTYTSGGRTVAEQPDTHIKKVTLDVFRRGRLVCSQTEFVSLEQFTGDPNPSSESVLSLLLSTPPNNAFLYQETTPGQAGSRALALSKTYPAEVEQFRADAASPLLLSGETDPLAAVNFYVGASGVLDTAAADSAGAFTANPSAVTAEFVEGHNTLEVQASKDGYTSPITRRAVLLDVAPPSFSGDVPAGTMNTLAPYVAVTLADVGTATTAVSGICPDVITLQVNGSSVPYAYDSTTGRVVWIDSTTNTAPVLPNGAYSVLAEGGDYAGYKTTQSWTFTLSVGDTDHSAPSIAERSPIGMAGSQWPEISVRVFDEQSGVVPSSIRMTLDGEVVVDSSNLGGHYDASDGTVSYMPPAEFASGGEHTVQIKASHFATLPADKITSEDAWEFHVP